MRRRFFMEEQGQGTLEYILFVGGIIVGVVVIWMLFSKMGGSSASKLDETSDATSSVMSSKLSAEIISMFD
jgi:hypothetical protein